MNTGSNFIPQLWANDVARKLAAVIDNDILRQMLAVSWAERVPVDEEPHVGPTFLTCQACMFGDSPENTWR